MPVNLASRLQQEAQVGGALLCAATAALLDGNHETADVDLGPRRRIFIKGFGDVLAYPLVTSAASAKVRAY